MNVSVITEAKYRESKQRFSHAFSREWGGEPDVTFITADQLVDALKSATGAVYQISTHFPLFDTNELARVFVLRSE
jgi:hypothetical protein